MRTWVKELASNNYHDLKELVKWSMPHSYLSRLDAEAVNNVLGLWYYELEWSVLKKKDFVLPKNIGQELTKQKNNIECINCKELQKELLIYKDKCTDYQQKIEEYTEDEFRRMDTQKMQDKVIWDPFDLRETIEKQKETIEKYKQALEEESEKQSELLRSNNEFRPFKEKYEELISKFDDEVEKKCGKIIVEKERLEVNYKEVQHMNYRYAIFLDKKWLVLPPA